MSISYDKTWLDIVEVIGVYILIVLTPIWLPLLLPYAIYTMIKDEIRKNKCREWADKFGTNGVINPYLH